MSRWICSLIPSVNTDPLSSCQSKHRSVTAVTNFLEVTTFFKLKKMSLSMIPMTMNSSGEKEKLVYEEMMSLLNVLVKGFKE